MSNIIVNIMMSIAFIGFLQIPTMFIPLISISKSNKFYKTLMILYELSVGVIAIITFCYFQYGRGT